MTEQAPAEDIPAIDKQEEDWPTKPDKDIRNEDITSAEMT